MVVSSLGINAACPFALNYNPVPEGYVAIYWLIDPADFKYKFNANKVKYVGATECPYDRLSKHVRHSSRKEVEEWINYLKNEGRYPMLIVINFVKKAHKIHEEIKEIKKLEAQGAQLLNDHYYDSERKIPLTEKVTTTLRRIREVGFSVCLSEVRLKG